MIGLGNKLGFGPFFAAVKASYRSRVVAAIRIRLKDARFYLPNIPERPIFDAVFPGKCAGLVDVHFVKPLNK